MFLYVFYDFSLVSVNILSLWSPFIFFSWVYNFYKMCFPLPGFAVFFIEIPFISFLSTFCSGNFTKFALFLWGLFFYLSKKTKKTNENPEKIWENPGKLNKIIEQKYWQRTASKYFCYFVAILSLQFILSSSLLEKFQYFFINCKMYSIPKWKKGGKKKNNKIVETLDAFFSHEGLNNK